MKSLARIGFALASLGWAVVGCADAHEGVESNEDALIGWLVSPPTFDNADLVGTWVPREASGFVGPAKSFTYAADGSFKECTGSCAKAGSWDITNHPIPTSVIGTYVNMHPTERADEFRFVWRHPSGEIRLVDIHTCSFLLFGCKDTWVKTPKLTVDNL